MKKQRKQDDKLLKATAAELSEAKKVLRSEKKGTRKFKGSKLEKDNKKRAVESVTLGVEAVQNRFDAMEEKLEKEDSRNQASNQRK